MNPVRALLQEPELLKEKAFIDGQWSDADSKATFSITNPFDNKVIANIPDMREIETKRAVDAAQNAFTLWKSKSANERASLLRKWFDLQIRHVDDLATILTMEQGKPFDEAKAEILYGASYVEWYAEEAKRIYGDTIPAPSDDKRILVIKQPIGVVAAITPWNFPNAMITRKVAPAIAAGCTVVIKPSKITPLSALALAELAERAGIPPGVINVITSGRASAIGNELASNSIIKKLSFTGSTGIGKFLIEKCAGTVKKLSMELGGNAPFIVFDDADIDAAVEGALISKYRNAGQTCVCTNRIYVQEGIHDTFVKKFREQIETQKLGNGMTSGVQIGPLIDIAAIAKVEELVNDAIDNGAKLITGGKKDELGELFFKPTLLTNVTDTMKITHEEIFGPVAPIYTFSSDEEVIERANNTPFGLAAYFYSQNIKRIWKISESLEYGMVGINTGAISNAAAPFGGVKESGFGREGSKYGIEEYLEIKYLCMGGI